MPKRESKDKKLPIFLSHASQDKPAVRLLCKLLRADGFDPWLDEERLLPGQNWSLEIEKALHSSDAILLCFSTLSVAKEGYIQREYKRAMACQEEKPEGTIFVIPVRLDECEMPFFIRELQWVDFPAGYDRLVLALNRRAGSVTVAAKPVQKKRSTKMSSKKKNSSSTTFNIKGGIHAGGNIIQGDQTIYHASRDIIQGDQVNYTINYQNIQSPAELAVVLQQVQAQMAALKQQPGLTGAQKQIVESAGKKVAEAAEESGKPEPLGERIQTTLAEAKDYMDSIGGSLQSAAALGKAIGGLLVMVAKIFGL